MRSRPISSLKRLEAIEPNDDINDDDEEEEDEDDNGTADPLFDSFLSPKFQVVKVKRESQAMDPAALLDPRGVRRRGEYILLLRFISLSPLLYVLLPAFLYTYEFSLSNQLLISVRQIFFLFPFFQSSWRGAPCLKLRSKRKHQHKKTISRMS